MKRCIVSTTVVFDKEHSRVILVNHRKLGVWLPPGGHVEPGELPSEAALREVMEETGLKVRLLHTSDKIVKDDVHAKQAHSPFVILHETVPYKEGRHMHFDMVYIADAGRTKFAKSHESTDINWFSRKELRNLKMFPNVRSILDAAFDEFG